MGPHYDKLGQEIVIDSWAAIPTGTHIQVGKVIKLTPQMVTLEVPLNQGYCGTWRKYPIDLIVLKDIPELTLYVLARK